MNTTLNEADFGDLSSDNPKAKYGLAKRLIELSKTEPAKLYPHFEYFVTLLKSDNNSANACSPTAFLFPSGAAMS